MFLPDYVSVSYKALFAIVACYAYDSTGPVDMLSKVCEVSSYLLFSNFFKPIDCENISRKYAKVDTHRDKSLVH